MITSIIIRMETSRMQGFAKQAQTFAAASFMCAEILDWTANNGRLGFTKHLQIVYCTDSDILMLQTSFATLLQNKYLFYIGLKAAFLFRWTLTLTSVSMDAVQTRSLAAPDT